jgi:hypothetical protein
MASGAGLSLVGFPKTVASPASTPTGPAIATSGTQIYIAWVDSDQRIWLTMAGGSANPASPPVALPDPIRTHFTPALAIFPPTSSSGVLFLYIAWLASYDSNIYYATMSADPTKPLVAGITTFALGSKSVIGAGSSGPSMTTFTNGVGIVFAGPPSDGGASSILYSYFNGAWGPVQTLIKANAGQDGMGTNQQPSICAFGTTVAVLWKSLGSHSFGNVFWSLYTLGNNGSLAPQTPNPTQIAGSETSGSPSIAVLQVQTQYFLYAAWKGSASDSKIFGTRGHRRAVERPALVSFHRFSPFPQDHLNKSIYRLRWGQALIRRKFLAGAPFQQLALLSSHTVHLSYLFGRGRRPF